MSQSRCQQAMKAPARGQSGVILRIRLRAWRTSRAGTCQRRPVNRLAKLTAWFLGRVGCGWSSVRVVSDGGRPLDLASLMVPLDGAVEATGDPFEPFRLVEDHGEDPSALGRADIEAFLHRLAFLASDEQLSHYCRSRPARTRAGC
jgi:hypothetical protein